MDGGRLRCFITFFTYNVLLLLVICLHDVDASQCKLQSGTVGETVVLSSDLPTEGVSSASWKYDNKVIADKDGFVSEQHPFMGRVDLNLTDFSLTIRKLTVQDSGNFSFVSQVDDDKTQRDTVCVTLKVQEVLSKQPELRIIALEQHAENDSCTVQLQCKSSSHSSVSYKWTVKNRTQSGSTLHFVLMPEDGDTTVTCTISNSLNKTSASKTLKCLPADKPEKTNFILFLGVAVGSSLVAVIIFTSIAVVCHRKHRRAEIVNESVYADICDVNENGTLSTMTPCSVYETIDNRVNTVNTVPPAPQTVYDKIQMNRVKPGVS